jgi:hypothetical protein
MPDKIAKLAETRPWHERCTQAATDALERARYPERANDSARPRAPEKG